MNTLRTVVDYAKSDARTDTERQRAEEAEKELNAFEALAAKDNMDRIATALENIASELIEQRRRRGEF